MTHTISDGTIPDLDLILECGSREEIVKNIRAQVEAAMKKKPNIETARQYYNKKMAKTTDNTTLTFLEDASILQGCIPMPEAMISSLHSHRTRIMDIFHTLLDINQGDMLLFYSEISYNSLVKKLERYQSRVKLA
jgi:S-adenosylmethionine:diacylglycerol 3-amino-3-carboxypropyl transferase